MVRKITTLNTDYIVSEYLAGRGVRGISVELGVSPRPIERILKENGIALRNRSEGMFARMARATPAERAQLAAAANQAARGRVVSVTTKAKMARTMEITGRRRRSVLEDAFRQMMARRGILLEPQTAIGPYNCDLTRHPVAVEIFGGHWHWAGAHFLRAEERIRYILDAGWHLLCYAFTKKTWPLTAEVADYAAAQIDLFSRKPTNVCEYWVIWGAGKFSTGGRADDNHISIVPPFTNRRNPRTGRYERVPR